MRLIALTEQGEVEWVVSKAHCAKVQPGDWVAYTPGPPPTVQCLATSSITTSCNAIAFKPEGDVQRWRRTVEISVDESINASAPSGVTTRMALLRDRHRIVRAVQDWFDGQGFLEVHTPALVTAPSPEPVFEPVSAGDGMSAGYLATSPEFQLKRMLVGGFGKIVRMGPAFRGGEVGAHHNPEFTLLEWYRAFEDSTALIADLQGLLAHLAPLVQSGAAPLPLPPYPVLTVAQCFASHLGMDITAITTADALRQAAAAARVDGWARLPGDFTGAFSELWIRIEAAFDPAPRFIIDWPAPTASLARLKPGDPTVAERVECYAGGLELANGFAELTDPVEQRRRFEADLTQRSAQGLPPVPLDEAFLSALEEGMPPAAGMALGVDRLVMLLTGARNIRDVLPFAWDER